MEESYKRVPEPAQLKSCPCCGGRAQLRYTKGNPSGWTSNAYKRSEPGFVLCIKCGLRTPNRTRVCRAVDAWNVRSEVE